MFSLNRYFVNYPANVYYTKYYTELTNGVVTRGKIRQLFPTTTERQFLHFTWNLIDLHLKRFINLRRWLKMLLITMSIISASMLNFCFLNCILQLFQHKYIICIEAWQRKRGSMGGFTSPKKLCFAYISYININIIKNVLWVPPCVTFLFALLSLHNILFVYILKFETIVYLYSIWVWFIWILNLIEHNTFFYGCISDIIQRVKE